RGRGDVRVLRRTGRVRSSGRCRSSAWRRSVNTPGQRSSRHSDPGRTEARFLIASLGSTALCDLLGRGSLRRCRTSPDSLDRARATMGITFPGESAEYRAARDQLLEQEIELRRAMEAVAAARRRLPPGGIVPEDYLFQGAGPDGNPT